MMMFIFIEAEYSENNHDNYRNMTIGHQCESYLRKMPLKLPSGNQVVNFLTPGSTNSFASDYK